MGADEPGPSDVDVFNVARIRRLVELMEEHGLTEVDLRLGQQRIRLRRGNEAVGVAAPPPMASGFSAGPPLPVAMGPLAAANDPQAPHEPGMAYIRSPMVGTYYGRPNPESEAFVKVGDLVTPETTVCIIEAMKVFNEIAAEIRGKIVAALVENEEPVEFGKPLFKVELGK